MASVMGKDSGADPELDAALAEIRANSAPAPAGATTTDPEIERTLKRAAVFENIDMNQRASVGDRALASFGANPDQQLSIYQAQYPNAAVDIDPETGRVVIQEPGQPAFFADPPGMDAGDIADVAGTIPEVVGSVVGSMNLTNPIVGAGIGGGGGDLLRQVVAAAAGGGQQSVDPLQTGVAVAGNMAGEGLGRKILVPGARSLGRSLWGPGTDEVSTRAVRAMQTYNNAQPEYGDRLDLTPGQMGNARAIDTEAGLFNNPWTRDKMLARVEQQNRVMTKTGGLLDTALPAEEPGVVGRNLADMVEQQRRTNQQILERATADVADSVADSLGRPAEAAEIGERVKAALQTAKQAAKAQREKQYEAATALMNGDHDAHAAAAQVAREKIAGILRRQGIEPGVDKIGDLNRSVDGKVLAALEKAWRELGEPRNVQGAPSYARMNINRRAIGNLMDDPTLQLTDETGAALNEAYGAFKEAQRSFLTEDGNVLLDVADDTFQAVNDDLAQLSQLQAAHNMPKIFQTKPPAVIAALKRRLEQAGETQVLDELQRRWLVSQVDDMVRPDRFTRQMVPGNEKFFPPGQIDSAAELSGLSRAVKEAQKRGENLDTQDIQGLVGAFSNAGLPQKAPHGLMPMRELSRLAQNPDEVLKIFSNSKSAAAVRAQAEAAGQPGLFDDLRKTYLRKLLNDAGSLENLQKRIQKMPDSVRAMFSNDELETAMDLAALDESMKRAGAKSVTPGGGDGRVVVGFLQDKLLGAVGGMVYPARQNLTLRTLFGTIDESALSPVQNARLKAKIARNWTFATQPVNQGTEGPLREKVSERPSGLRGALFGQ